MTDYTQKILASPDALQQFEILQKVIHDEKRRRLEFREWISPNEKAEFVNGEVILHSPVKKRHWYVTDLLSSLLSIYVRRKKLGKIGTEKVMIGLSRNDYEPDLVFFSKEKADLFTEDQMIFPAPDFVVEILSKKTAAIDRGVKKQDYAAHGVGEYWIVDPFKQQIEQYFLPSPSEKTYFPARIFKYSDGIESRVIVGFSIPVSALFDESENLAVLEELLK